MLTRWSIRASLVVVGLFLIAMTMLTGTIGFFALNRVNTTIDQMAHQDLAAAQALDDASSNLLRIRALLERADALIADGKADATKPILERAQSLDAQEANVWQTFADLSKGEIEPGVSSDLIAAHASLMRDNVDAALAALQANDAPSYRRIMDTGLNAVFDAYDGNASTAARELRQRADDRQHVAQASIVFMRALIVVVTVFVVVMVFVIGLVLHRMVVLPLANATGHFDRIASGDLTRQVDARDDDTEIGHLFRGIKHMQESIATMVRTVASSIESIDTGAREIATGNMDLSQRTEQQAASLQQTASSMEQLTGTVRQNADSARQASQLALNASGIATRGGEVVSQVIHTMQDIATSSRKVTDIISVIEGIAFQTNILALNAAVEAARAGEQGRGFAVVAGEVRSLAQRSAHAAREIKELIGDSAGKVHSGSELVGHAGTTMDEIVQAVQRVTDIMGEISAASAEQSSGIGRVNEAVVHMDAVTQQNAALVEEAAAAASSLGEQTGQLRIVVGKWQLTDGQSVVTRAVSNPPKREAVQAAPPVKPRMAVKPAAAVGFADRAASERNRDSTDQPATNPPALEVAAGADEDDWEKF